MFIFETVFISEQIAGSSFGALQEISYKFMTKLHI